MNTALCLSPTWGRDTTASVRSPHPWLQSLEALRGEPAGAEVATYLVQASQSELRRIAALPEDWDGAGSAGPRPASVANASARLIELCKIAMMAGRWMPPHISASESGQITFEWWHGDRKLTVYFGDTTMEVLRVWGANIDDEMEHLHLTQTGPIANVWAWLYGN